MRFHARLTAAMLLLPVAASAQTPAELAHIAAKVRELGSVIAPNTARLYAPFHAKEPYTGVQVLRDLKYGPDDRQALDLFVPPPLAGGARPVLIFIGGSLIDGDKHALGPFYDNVMLWAARNGMIGVNADHRRAPAHPWPAGAQDVSALVSWVRQNVAPYGGNPERIFLVGHSAGATHAASYVSHPEFYGPYGLGLAGLALVSGLYEPSAAQAGPDEKAYFGDDPALYPERSAFGGIRKLPMPLFVAHAEFDPPALIQQAAALKDALCKKDRCPREVALPGHNHMSEVYAINTTDKSLSDPLTGFIKKHQ